MERIKILWEVSPGVVLLGGALCVMTACFAMLAAYTMICPSGEEESGDVYI